MPPKYKFEGNKGKACQFGNIFKCIFINLVEFLPKKNHHFSLTRPTERERTERLIKTKLREIMMQKDLENITSKEVSDLESRNRIDSKLEIE